jgi:pyruvate formate lyase activating enzyme
MGGVRYFIAEAEGFVRCSLCPQNCKIPSGYFGLCGVRGNKNGKGLIPFYGHVSSLALDPIEKKPLYHFRPGSMILSAGFVGCNLRCPFCQNWHISQNTDVPVKKMSPGDLVSAALHGGSTAIAYTYSEPLVHAEFLLDCMVLAHRHGIANVLVTNGCVSSETAEDILSLTYADNVDLKCFSGENYSKTLGGAASSHGGILDAVIAFIKTAVTKGVHVELTTLVVPGFNDSVEELEACAGFIASVCPDIPWHLSAYHPEYKWNAPPTNAEFLLEMKKRFSGILRHVYVGNIGIN